jgi:transcriptional regulator GlxA family with amidase domain
MQKAGDLLRQEGASLEQIAVRVGYDSGAAFSKAFKREIGIPPGLYRRAGLELEATDGEARASAAT